MGPSRRFPEGSVPRASCSAPQPGWPAFSLEVGGIRVDTSSHEIGGDAENTTGPRWCSLELGAGISGQVGGSLSRVPQEGEAAAPPPPWDSKGLGTGQIAGPRKAPLGVPLSSWQNKSTLGEHVKDLPSPLSPKGRRGSSHSKATCTSSQQCLCFLPCTPVKHWPPHQEDLHRTVIFPGKGPHVMLSKDQPSAPSPPPHPEHFAVPSQR